METLTKYLPSHLLTNQEVLKVLKSRYTDDMPPLEVAKMLVLLSHQIKADGNLVLSSEIRAAAEMIVDQVVQDGIDGLSLLT